MAQVSDGRHRESAFLRTNMEAHAAELLKDFFDIEQMLVEGWAENKDVVGVRKGALKLKAAQNRVNVALEIAGSVDDTLR